MPPLDNPKRERFYVYELVDPRDGRVFYVGKGCGNRHAIHVKDWRRGRIDNARKYDRIDRIERSGLHVIERIAHTGLIEADAFRIERELIAANAGEHLCNIMAGSSSDLSRAYEHAKVLLRTVLPFCAWYNRAPRKPSDIAMYWDVIGHLKDVITYTEQGHYNAVR